MVQLGVIIVVTGERGNSRADTPVGKSYGKPLIGHVVVEPVFGCKVIANKKMKTVRRGNCCVPQMVIEKLNGF